MRPIHPKFWQSLIRNRRGAACVACFCLVFGIVAMFGVWGFLCLCQRTMFDLPSNMVHAIYALAALKAWTTGTDFLGAVKTPPEPLPPGVDTPPGA